MSASTVSPTALFHRVIITACAVVSSALLIGCSAESASTDKPQATLHQASLLTTKLQTGYQATRQYLGKVNSKQLTSLSFEYNGKVNDIFVDHGESVVKGQVLAQQDTELLDIKLAEISAQQAQNHAQLSLNKANLARLTSLDKQGYASKQSIDELTAEQQVLMANAKALLANVNALKYQIEKAQLLAPFDGVVRERFIAQGELASPSAIAYEMLRTNQQEITVGVPASMASKLSLGETFTTDISGVKTTATLINIGQHIDATVRTVQLRLTIPENAYDLNGQLARVNLQYQNTKSGYWIPLSAITDGVRGQWNVYLASRDHDNVFQLTAATVKVLYTTQSHAFISGLANDEVTIVARGLHRFAPGQKVSGKTEQQVATSTLAQSLVQATEL